MEGGDCVDPALWDAHQLQGANRGFYSREVAQRDIESLVVIADEKIEHDVG